jgi:agmatinase
MNEVHERGLAAVTRTAIDEVLQHADTVYISVDIDVLDPAFAPGTGTPEPGGLHTADLLRAVRAIALECPIAGMDVVEVAPAYDHADLTVNAAHRIIFEVLAGMAERRRRAR